mgnify:CR=1 FL=1
MGLSVSPGPNGLLALTHGALYGSRKTLFTITGGVVGFVALIGLCMFGIGALIKSSLVWLTVLKWVGGMYLVGLGVQVWRSPPIALSIDTPPAQAHGITLFRQGWLSAVTNPKGLLFFSAFLPQFMDQAGDFWLQMLIFESTFLVLAFANALFYALTASRARDLIGSPKTIRLFNRSGGALLTAAGLAVFWQSRTLLD